MKNSIAALLMTCTITAQAQSKEIALTFDDCPRRTGVLMSGMDRAKKLTEQLKRNKVEQVAFFCNSPSRAPDGQQRIEYFASQGHLIANHSATHPNLTSTDPKEYIKNIERADQELSSIKNYRKWFRYPYLHEGKTIETRDEIRKYLSQQGYLNAYVTIDTGDWYLDDLLGEAAKAGKKINEVRLCEAYRDILADDIQFNEDLAMKALGHTVKHVILLHETDLNTICIGTLITWLRTHDWKIISPEVAFADPISRREPDTLFLGQGRVAALAKEKGYKGKLFSKWNEESDMKKEFERRGVWE